MALDRVLIKNNLNSDALLVEAGCIFYLASSKLLLSNYPASPANREGAGRELPPCDKWPEEARECRIRLSTKDLVECAVRFPAGGGPLRPPSGNMASRE